MNVLYTCWLPLPGCAAANIMGPFALQTLFVVIDLRLNQHAPHCKWCAEDGLLHDLSASSQCSAVLQIPKFYLAFIGDAAQL